MPSNRVMEFELESKGSIADMLTAESAALARGDTTKRDYVVRLVEMGLKKGKMNSWEESEPRALLQACTLLDRPDLFLKALGSVARALDDRCLMLVAQQIQKRGCAELEQA